MFQMRPDGTGQDPALDITSALTEFFGQTFVGDAFDILFDDRAFIQIRRGVMGGGADHFHAAFPCAVVWITALECGEKCVMDIDYAVGIFSYDLGSHQRKVSCKNDEFST